MQLEQNINNCWIWVRGKQESLVLSLQLFLNFWKYVEIKKIKIRNVEAEGEFSSLQWKLMTPSPCLYSCLSSQSQSQSITGVAGFSWGRTLQHPASLCSAPSHFPRVTVSMERRTIGSFSGYCLQESISWQQLYMCVHKYI